MKRSMWAVTLAGALMTTFPAKATDVSLSDLATNVSCFGQTDDHIIAVGDWSEPVSDKDGHTLRGRLLIYDAMGQNIWGNWEYARVYLELQHPLSFGWYSPIEVYFDSGRGLHFEMRDGHDRPIPSEPYSIGAFTTNPYWITLPCDSTVRVRADPGLGSSSKPDGFCILAGGEWIIRPGTTNDYFLSGTFIPPTNHPSCLNYHVWQGTLSLPKVKIPVKKP